MLSRLLPSLIFGLAGAAVLIALGVWQVPRLAWKEAILDEISATIHAAPRALPAHPDPATDRFMPVTVSGTTRAPEILVQASHKLVGPGFRVLAPFETDDGRRILVDRGFIRLSDRDVVRPPQPMTLTGNLHWPDEVDGFTPPPDPDGRLWFARDVPALAARLGTEPVLVVVRDTTPTDPPVTPLPVTTEGIPNDHLQYAVTWFLLAAVWLGMTAYLIAGLWRRARKEQIR